MITSLFHKAKDFAKRIFVEDNSAHSIAMGLALGIFIGVLPTFGFQMIPALALSLRFKINKLAAAAGVWVTNPLTVIPIYSFNYWVGANLFPQLSANIGEFKDLLTAGNFDWKVFWNMSYSALLPLCLGSLINASVFSTIIYFLCKLSITTWLRWKKKEK